MTRTIGAKAEAIAWGFLEKQGLALLQRNWRSRFGEIDLVLRDGDTIVFVEVRLRTNHRFGAAGESIDRTKRSRLLAAARHYLARKPPRPCRFDVVLFKGLDPPQVEWIRDAFSE